MSSHSLPSIKPFVLVCLALSLFGCVEAEPLGRTPDVDLLQVVPVSDTLEVGDTRLLGAADLEDGVATDATSTVRWSSDDESVVTVGYSDEDGAVLEAVGSGTAEITASLDGKKASTFVQVLPSAASLELDKGVFELAKGTALPLDATMITIDGTKRELGSDVSWGTSDAQVATVEAGLVRGVGVGDALISVTRKGLTAMQRVHVRDWTLESVEATPVGGATLPIAQQTSIQITGTFTGGHTQRIDSLFTLNVEAVDADADAEAAPAVSVAPPTVVVAGAAKGDATVIGTGLADSIAEGKAFSLTFTVVEAELSELTLDLPALLPVDEVVSAGVTGRYGDSIQLDTAAPLTADPADKVKINNATSTITGLAAGDVTITATIILEDGDGDPATGEAIEATQDLQVVAADVSALALASTNDSIAVDATASLSAEATFGSAGTTLVTEPAVWSSSDETVAVVSNVTAGRVTGLSAGTATITAAYRGKTATFEVTVTQ